MFSPRTRASFIERKIVSTVTLACLGVILLLATRTLTRSDLSIQSSWSGRESEGGTITEPALCSRAPGVQPIGNATDSPQPPQPGAPSRSPGGDPPGPRGPA